MGATPPPSISIDPCIHAHMTEKGSSYDEAKQACFNATNPAPIPPAVQPTSSMECVARYQKEKGLTYEEAMRACSALPTTQPVPATDIAALQECIARHQKEKNLSYDEAKRACLPVYPMAVQVPVPVAVPAGECIARLQKEKNLNMDEAKRACAVPPPALAPDSAAALLECIARTQKEKGATYDEAKRLCYDRSATETRPAPFFHMPPEAVGAAVTIIPNATIHSPVSAQAKAVDSRGGALEVVPGTLTFETTPAGPVMELPVLIAPGRELKVFHDPTSDFVLAGNEASLPIRAPDGKTLGVLLMEVGEPSASPGGARVALQEVRLVAPEVREDFSARDPEVGVVGAQITVNLGGVPAGAELKVDPELQVEPRQEALFRQAAQAEGLVVRDFAYQVKVEKQNLAPEAATITLKVDPKWVEAQGGPEKARILRDDEQGSVTVLETYYAGLDEEGRAVFVAPSPGLSVFSLAAVENVKAPPKQAAPLPVGMLGLVAAIGAGVGMALGSVGRPPGGGMNPWLRMAMKSSGELKDAEQIQKKQD